MYFYSPTSHQYIKIYNIFVCSDFLTERSQSEVCVLSLEVRPGVAGGRHPLEGVLRLHSWPVLLPLLSPILVSKINIK